MIKKIVCFIKKNQLLLSILVLFIPTVFKRLAFYLNFPIVWFTSDSLTYYHVVDQMNIYQLPNLEVRTPLYPLLIKVSELFFNSNISLILMQSFLVLASSIFFLIALDRTFKKYLLFFSCFLMLFINSTDFLIYETSMLTESVYISAIFVFFSVLLFALRSTKIIWWVTLPIVVWAVILIKPTGMFLLVVMGALIIYMLFNKYSRKFYFALILPQLIIYSLYCSYNYYNIGQFKLTAFGGMNLLGTSMAYLSTDSENSKELNEVIMAYNTGIAPNERIKDAVEYYSGEIKMRQLTDLEKRILENSCNPDTLSKVFSNRIYTGCAIFNCLLMSDTMLFPAHRKENESPLIYLEPLNISAAESSINKHFTMYIKHFITGVYIYFFSNSCNFISDRFLENILRRYDALFLHNPLKGDYKTILPSRRENYFWYSDSYFNSVNNRRNEFLASYLKEYFYERHYSGINVFPSGVQFSDDYLLKVGQTNGEYMMVVYSDFLLKSIYFFDRMITQFFFFNNGWFLGINLFLVAIISIICLLRKKIKDRIFFFIFILTFSAILQGFLVCLVEAPLARYSYTLEFIKYFALIFLYIMIKEELVTRISKKKIK